MTRRTKPIKCDCCGHEDKDDLAPLELNVRRRKVFPTVWACTPCGNNMAYDFIGHMGHDVREREMGT